MMKRIMHLCIKDFEYVEINITKPNFTLQNLQSLVTIRMNEIFRCLACYGRKLSFLFRNRDKHKHKHKL